MPIAAVPSSGWPGGGGRLQDVVDVVRVPRGSASEKGSVLKTTSSRVMWLRSGCVGRLDADIAGLGRRR